MRANTLLKTLTNAVLPPPVAEFWAGRLNPLWSRQRALASVVGRQQEARDTITLILRPNGRFHGFAAGQHVNVTVDVEGVRLTRSYSPSRLPGQPGLLAITVKRVPGGKVSNWLCDQTPAGGIVELGTAFGDMTLEAAPGPALLLAAGSGITPFVSLIRASVAAGMPQPITLLYWARSEEDLCFAGELQALATQWPTLNVHFILTGAGGEGARINKAQLQALVPSVQQAGLFACGPEGFVDAAAGIASALGRPFMGEAFTAPVVHWEPGQQVRVHLARSGKTVSVPAGKPLLQALEDVGLRPASGCRRGICNTCACGKREGVTAHVLTQDVQAEPAPSLRICINSARSDLTLDL